MPPRYYITGAPQCPFPDAYMGRYVHHALQRFVTDADNSVINAVGFDAIYVQFCMSPITLITIRC